MNEQIEPISSWVPGDDQWAKTLYLSAAYAEAAEVLCSALIDDDFTRQYTSVMVIRYLCRHAVELYLKGALGIKGEKVPNHHHLDKLHDLYSKAYPETKFHFTLPIEAELLTSYDLFANDELEQLKKTEPERFRYAANKAGDLFREGRPFNITSELAMMNRPGFRGGRLV